MLTNEILDANTELASLTAEQKNAIVTLSKNDEDAVISQKIGEIYGGLDNDIFTASNIAKEGTEKTYAYAKRVIGNLIEKANGSTDLQNKIDSLTRDNARLQKAVENGADSEIKKQLSQSQADLANVQKMYNELNDKYTSIETQHAKDLLTMRIESELATTKAGIKFKSNIPEVAAKSLYSQAEAEIKNASTEIVDDGKGGKTLVFKDAEGTILRNPNNQLNPYTAGELLLKKLEGMGILDNGKPNKGSGTQPQQPKGNGTMDLSGARTRTEAMGIIENYLMSKGLTKLSKEYDTEMQQIWTDNNVSKLPLK